MKYDCPEFAMEILDEIREEMFDEIMEDDFPGEGGYEEYIDRLWDITRTMRSPKKRDVVRWLQSRVEYLTDFVDFVQQEDPDHAQDIRSYGLARAKKALAEVLENADVLPQADPSSFLLSLVPPVSH
jgi:hypothetical protein